MTSITTFAPGEISQAVSDNSGLLFIHFGSPLASYCESIHRQLELLLPLFKNNVRFAEVELPLQDFELIRNFQLEEIPTLILFSGGEEVERLEEVPSLDSLKEFLQAAVSFYCDPQSKQSAPKESISEEETDLPLAENESGGTLGEITDSDSINRLEPDQD